MQFGFFDDESKEYVITNPATPKSWSNYLGSTEYGAIITNNAGGYSFYYSAAQGRFMRLRFNSIPMDQPGRYLYLHDRDKNDYWSASWQPVGKPLEKFKTVCRHGTAYTKIDSEYEHIKTETTYFVPLDQHFECWLMRVTNQDKVKRRLRAFTFVEYANNWHLWQDFVNLQYTQGILCMDVVDNIIDHGINVMLPDGSGDFQNHDGNRHTFIGAIGAAITGYDTDRDVFLGPYRTYANPIAVEKGECSNSIAVGDNGCGTLQMDIDLAPGESREIVVLMGIGKAAIEGKKVIQEYRNNPTKVHDEFEKVKQFWHSRIEGMTVETADAEFNSMTNMWSPFNCLMTYAWSRAASLVYSGERDGLGYRDTVQDILGVLHTIPDEAGGRLELMITGQVSTGGAMPVVKPFAHHPGKETPPKEEDYRSDDCMWLFNTIPAYVKETGDLAFYDKVLPYADKGEATVLGHLRRAIEFNLERSGAHGFPCGLYADWNDCLELGHNGETVFVAFQLRYALKTYVEICEMKNLAAEVTWAQGHLNKLDANIQKHAWDGEWFIRAYRYDGMKFGSKENEEGSLWLNPQSWSVYSEYASREQAEMVTKAVRERLATEYGVVIVDPPYEKVDHRIVKAPLFNKGMKENGAIFCHTQGWAVIAETLLGNGNNAYKYYRSFMPAACNTKAEIRQIEPYVNCQFTHSKYSPRFGASRLPWLSGTASWSYYTATQYILGIQPQYNGLKIDPCIPEDWTEFKVQRRFRGKHFNIIVQNHDSVQKGVVKMIMNDEELQDNFIPVEKMKATNEVLVVMG
ncbi:N,N'-diacetylchitobiose phosphorylase [candidate division KSB1 bacterium]|nr:N,N'-diacetylchitobiose phosphorylase [candidate division KSB1 bacterium]